MIKIHLEELLHARRMSIRELSKRLDYRFESIRLLYRGEVSRLPVDLIEKICIEFNCEVGDLITIEKEDTTNDKGQKIKRV